SRRQPSRRSSPLRRASCLIASQALRILSRGAGSNGADCDPDFGVSRAAVDATDDGSGADTLGVGGTVDTIGASAVASGFASGMVRPRTSGSGAAAFAAGRAWGGRAGAGLLARPTGSRALLGR